MQKTPRSAVGTMTRAAQQRGERQRVPLRTTMETKADTMDSDDRIDSLGIGEDKMTVTPLFKVRAPIGGQEIELQQIEYVIGGLSLLRVRIREGRRHTVFDIDAETATAWGEAMLRWGQAHAGAGERAP